METPNEMRTKIVGKATGDADFRAWLLRDPKAAIGAEPGVNIPKAMTIEVHEEAAATTHPVLPPASRLSDGDLQAVTAGAEARNAIFGQEVPAGATASVCGWMGM